MKNEIKIFTVFLTAVLINACSPVQSQPEVDKKCTQPRPQVCTMDYQPVCGIQADGTKKTYSNGCSACSDLKVIGYNEGECR